MGKVIDFGRNPLPGSGVFVVKTVDGSRELGRVRASSVDEAKAKARREIPATEHTSFLVSELPVGEA